MPHVPAAVGIATHSWEESKGYAGFPGAFQCTDIQAIAFRPLYVFHLTTASQRCPTGPGGYILVCIMALGMRYVDGYCSRTSSVGTTTTVFNSRPSKDTRAGFISNYMLLRYYMYAVHARPMACLESVNRQGSSLYLPRYGSTQARKIMLHATYGRVQKYPDQPTSKTCSVPASSGKNGKH